jgi:DNA-binding MarR family transcriptional regulator
MVFGMDEKQRLILAYLYYLRDTPESPPDQRLSVGLIAKHLNMTQQNVRNKIKKLIKWGYVSSFTFERRTYYKI